ncbi:MAG TPA: adenylate/guanylate cyclase domain-containing protein [Xanthobacteraceae bacterium]|jgi:adenylate cyclase|nr:adenylate/guanylate cyclase domain-containing protein [Xanthobacteraceae bacterium]
MFRQSIKQKIIGIALGLIVLMVITSVLSTVMAGRVGHLLDELANKYVVAYGDLARTNIYSLKRSLAVRRMVIAKMQNPPDDAVFDSRVHRFQEEGLQVEQEAQDARKLVASIIDDPATPSDDVALAKIDARLDDAIKDVRRHLDEENAALIRELQAGKIPDSARLARIDELRDEFNQNIDAIRSDMLSQVRISAAVVMGQQRQMTVISLIVTALAAILGLVFAVLVGGGVARPAQLLLEGTREVEAGRFDHAIEVKSRDEIGQLSAAFNRMVERLRQNERVRETFGRYIDPRVVEGLVDQPEKTATEGQRRVMTVLFCDMKGFTSLSEGMTPQGLVKVMNRYLSVMSEPIRAQRGIIDKYIGDAIMAYWGPPFVEDQQQAGFACAAVVDMIAQVPTLRRELPELLGVRSIPVECDIRIGIATGEALVGSIGSEYMMSFTVMGDTVNLASRLESANKIYGTRVLVTAATVAGAGDLIEAREIDRLVVIGQSQPQTVFEIMGRKGELSPEQLKLRTSYAEGMSAYRAHRWDDALTSFRAALEAVPGDGPATALLHRIAALKDAPPPADWDGAWHLEHK